jgi:hypothetical protein
LCLISVSLTSKCGYPSRFDKPLIINSRWIGHGQV